MTSSTSPTPPPADLEVRAPYRVREFAALRGVTVRALHHYDRAGLLNPRRTSSGYRVYRHTDLPRLQQILVLKFLGMPLADIADALKSRSTLDDLLKTRRYAIKRKREQLAWVLHLLDELQEESGADRNWADLASFVRAGSALVRAGAKRSNGSQAGTAGCATRSRL